MRYLYDECDECDVCQQLQSTLGDVFTVDLHEYRYLSPCRIGATSA